MQPLSSSAGTSKRHVVPNPNASHSKQIVSTTEVNRENIIVAVFCGAINVTEKKTNSEANASTVFHRLLDEYTAVRAACNVCSVDRLLWKNHNENQMPRETKWKQQNKTNGKMACMAFFVVLQI